MSSVDDTRTAAHGQDESAKECRDKDYTADMAALKRIELQISLGVVTQRSLCRVMRVGPHTVAAWIKSGALKPFRPATGELYFRPDDVREFMSARPTIAGNRPQRRKKK